MTNKRFDNYLHPLSVTPALTAHPALASYSNPVKPKSLVSITDIKPQTYIQQIVKSEVRTVICFISDRNHNAEMASLQIAKRY